MSKKLPPIRNKDIVMQNLEKELLIYDLKTNRAFCLNETLATVYKSCDGKTSFDEIRKKHKLTYDLILLALDQLQTNNLLEEKRTGTFSALSRREVIRKIGLTSMVTLPIISSLVAPAAINAASAAAITCVNPSGAPTGTSVGATRAIGIRGTCGEHGVLVTNGCTSLYGSQCCTNTAVERGCTQGTNAQGPIAYYSCKCG